jgi:hypothetical protein
MLLGGFMDILKALKREEAKLEKYAKKAIKHLAVIRATMTIFGGRGWVGSGKKSGPARRRKMSAAGRSRIARAQKARWAKVRAAKAKAA